MAIEHRSFGDAFREARLAKGWSQERVARALEVSKTTIQSWEGDAKEPRLGYLLRICKLFGWELPFLVASGDAATPELFSRLPSALATSAA